MKKLIFGFIVVFFGAMTMVSCNKTNKEDNPSEANFDKKAMLQDYADNQIIPAYQEMKVKLAALEVASNDFIDNPSITTQAELKIAYTQAHLQYVRIAPFRFGPAESNLIDNFFNFSGGLDYSFTTDGELTGFSIDTNTILANINSGAYNLENLSRSSFYSQGFPALNYLYFEPNAINKINASRAQYIRNLTARMKLLLDKVSNEWVSYRASFVDNLQSNSGSPIANIVNQIAFQVDVLKGPRIGWPLGKASNGKIFETKCESYFSGIALTLAKEHLNSVRRLYIGTNSLRGIADYLIAINQSQLNTDIQKQFDVTAAKLNEISDPLSTSLIIQYSAVDAAYKEIQKLNTLLKTDLPSVTAVQISYTDNDGD